MTVTLFDLLCRISAERGSPTVGYSMMRGVGEEEERFLGGLAEGAPIQECRDYYLMRRPRKSR